MNDMIEKFDEWLDNNLRNVRYENIAKFAKQARYYEIDKSDALSILYSRYCGESTRKDQERFLNAAWDYFKNKPTYSDYKKDKISLRDYVKSEKENEKAISSIQRQLNNELKFYNYIADLRKTTSIKDWLKENNSSFEKTSKFMLNVFDENDLIWVSKSPIVENIETEMKDMLAWTDKNERLGKYNYFVINPFQDDSARKQSNIKKFKYTLLESDDLTKEEQFLLWINLINAGLPVKMVTYTGNKSLHILVKVNPDIETEKQYNEYVSEIHKHFNRLKTDLIDGACRNADRLSRIPFGIRNDEKTDYEDAEQKLIYIQKDNSKLNKDALEVIKEWVNSILLENKEKQKTFSQVSVDEISSDELLAMFKNRDLIHDIWDDGKSYHTFQRLGEIDESGNIRYRYADKKWDRESSFWNFIRQTLNEQYNTKFELKDIKNQEIKFKNSMKRPYIGEKHGVKKDVVNTFIPGWLYEALNDNNIPAELNEPLEKMLDNLFGNNIEERKWVLQWMREFMHTFNVITAPVFWQHQGTGKTMLSKAFGEAIGDWIKTPPKKDDIQFNAWQDHTVIIFEESSSGNKRDGKDLGDLLKDWITESEKTIESKGKDPIKKTIQSCYIFNANISDSVAPVYIENGDRRYTIIKNEYAINLKDIWTEEDFKMWDKGLYKKQLMKWIYNLPKDYSVDIRKGINNDAKQDVVNLGKNNIELALEEIVKTFTGFISCGELIDIISTQYGIRSTARANGNILKNLGYDSKIKKINGSVIRGYIFNGEDNTTQESVLHKDIINVL